MRPPRPFDAAALRTRDLLHALVDLGSPAAEPLFIYADALEAAQRRYDAAADTLAQATDLQTAADPGSLAEMRGSDPNVLGDQAASQPPVGQRRRMTAGSR